MKIHGATDFGTYINYSGAHQCTERNILEILRTSSVPLQATHRHQGQGGWWVHQGGEEWGEQIGHGQVRYAYANLQRNRYTSSAACHWRSLQEKNSKPLVVHVSRSSYTQETSIQHTNLTTELWFLRSKPPRWCWQRYHLHFASSMHLPVVLTTTSIRHHSPKPCSILAALVSAVEASSSSSLS